MTQSLRHLWKRVATQHGSLQDWKLIARLAIRLFYEQRIERIRFADTGVSGVYKCDVRFRFKTEIHYAYGVGTSLREALLKSLAEAAERSISYDANRAVQTSSEVTLDTHTFGIEQYTEIRSVQGQRYADGTHVVIPAQCIRRWSKQLDGNGVRLFPYTTSGIAAHTDKQCAVQYALYEVIERDAFLCYWYARHAPQVMQMSGAPEDIQALMRLYEDLDIQVDILLLKHETGIPVIAAIGSCDHRGMRRRVLSLGCKENLDDAIVSALKELFIVKSHLYAESDPPISYDTITAFGRARLWRGDLCAELDYFRQGSAIDYQQAKSNYADTNKKISLPDDAMVYTYLTPAAFPLSVVKVIVPSYFPFFLHEPFKKYGERRLRAFCAMLGIPYQMGSIPHVLP